MRAMRGWRGGSWSDSAAVSWGALRLLSALVRSPGLPAPVGRLRQNAQQAHLRQGLGYVVPGEAPADFAFQFVREAARVFLTAQCPLPPVSGLGHQFIVL